MGKASTEALVLDAGALIAFERADPRMRALVRAAIAKRVKLVIPAAVVAQVVRKRSRQVRLFALLHGETSVIPPLDLTLAEASGELCGRAGTSDIVDASVVLIARRERAIVVTSDVDDMRVLGPSLKLERI